MHFLTGFPGFLGFETLKRALARDPSAQFYCLIQEKFRGLALDSVQRLKRVSPDAENRVKLVVGDITQPDLALENASWKNSIESIFHFAAIYDLSVKEEVGKRINVDGTRHVLQFAESVPNLKRFHYVSTCYVSGRYDGVFMESDLEKGQRFNNFYESTKYEAEVLVRQEMKGGLPATIYRPAIVVGNSRTGETQKFDGPYYVIQWLLRNRKLALLPRLGDPEKTVVNLVPSDFVVEAITTLSQRPDAIGETFQLADPNPLNVKNLIEQLAKDAGAKVVEVPLPKAVTKGLMTALPFVESWLKIPKTSLDYFVHPTRYDVSTASRFLETASLRCPHFSEYSKILVDFMQAHPEVRAHALS